MKKEVLNVWDEQLIPAMKKQVLLLCVKQSQSGLSRYYEAYTVLNGKIERCTRTLSKLVYQWSSKTENMVVKGYGFSPVPDIALSLGVEQSVIKEEYVA